MSRHVGVSPELLRAWERRYGLLDPTRSAGGFRLYSHADVERIRAMNGHVAHGLSAAEAARAVLVGSGADEPPPAALAESRASFQEALERYDEAAANSPFDRLLATFSTDTVMLEIVPPVIRSLGDGWAEGRTTIAEEHFASNVLRGRLPGLARAWGRGGGPVAVLACPPGEQHDLALLLFGIALREVGCAAERSGLRCRWLGLGQVVAGPAPIERRVSLRVESPLAVGLEVDAADGNLRAAEEHRRVCCACAEEILAPPVACRDGSRLTARWRVAPVVRSVD